MGGARSCLWSHRNAAYDFAETLCLLTRRRNVPLAGAVAAFYRAIALTDCLLLSNAAAPLAFPTATAALVASLPAGIADPRASLAAGGAVYALGGSVAVSGTTLADNAAPFGLGGAVFVECDSGAAGQEAGQAVVAVSTTRFLRNTVRLRLSARPAPQLLEQAL